VRARPADFDDGDLIASVADGWGLQSESAAYVPEGGGSHHWKLVDRSRHEWFVTVDDLDDKDWLGDTRAMVFDGLRRCLETATALRRDANLSFVVAPVPSLDGMVVRRHGSRYAVSVYPYLEGESYPFGPYADSDLRAQVLELVIAIDAATASIGRLPLVHLPAVSRRDDLDAFLRDPDRPWKGGPFSEPAHEIFVTRARHSAWWSAPSMIWSSGPQGHDRRPSSPTASPIRPMSWRSVAV
jgi:hypothetical protein